MSSPVTFADVDAGVRAAIAAYTQAVDDGRTDDIVATFLPDASVDIEGLGAHQGHEALRSVQAVEPKWQQRHLVLNTLITRWDDSSADATSDVVFLFLGPKGWSVQLVGRYQDVLHREGDTWRFHRRTATFVAPS